MAAIYKGPKSVASPRSEGFEGEREEEWLDRAITLDRVYKKWETTNELAVGNVSFNAYCGQVTVLLGHEGSGKTTIMKMISGEVEASRGFICVLNLMKGHGNRYQGRGVGYCSQQVTLFECLTVIDHLWLFYCLKTGRSVWRDDVMSTANERVSELSCVAKRLLTLAIALVGKSPVVLMDEPFGNLSLEAKSFFKRVIDQQKEERCFLIATSSAEIAEMVADRIVALSDGRALAAGSVPFLKTTFGCSYILNIQLTDDASKSGDTIRSIEKCVRRYIPNAHLRQTFGKTIQIGFSSNIQDE
ncbi:unnamed protein product [Heligmosomoides polygyrus]|uniref:ABC transporter domain-containing protein n=1 Tax=Heligmosomoides polygyrus TaxID=6339 RepID=A0A183GGY9_HELPZ|nr:unnamed protein product [Heligmosomoides polygyrus]